MENNNWYFPPSSGGRVYGINNAAIVGFKVNPIKSLAREICQNSIDAKLKDSKEPVIVEFKSFEMDIQKFPGLNNFRNILQSCLEFCKKRNPIAVPFFERALNKMNATKLKMLRISDFNTKGLTTKDWEDLVINAGISNKQNDNSNTQGGSFGIGKNAPFACSLIQTVFYSTLNIENEVKSQGVAELTSFERGKYDDGELDISQATGFYGNIKEHSVDSLKNQLFLDESFNRDNSGTDIYVPGIFDEFFDSIKTSIIEAVLDSYLIAIWKKDLVVKVDGETISCDNLLEIIDKYEDTLSKNVITNAKLLFDENYKWHTFPIYISKTIKIGDISMLFKIHEEGTNKIAMYREMGMRILYQPNLCGSLRYTGIAVAEGIKLNKYLVAAENPAHDSWKTNDTTIKQIIKDIFSGITNELQNEVKKTPVEQLDIEGSGDYIPDIDEDEDTKSKTDDDAVNKIVNLNVKIIDKAQDVAHMETDEIGGNVQTLEGDEGDFQEGTEGEAYLHNGGKSTQTGERKPDLINFLEGDSEIGERLVDVKSKDIKLFCINKKENMYRLIFVPTMTSKKGFVEINQLDEQNTKQPLTIKKVFNDDIMITDNKFGYFKFIENEKITIDLVLDCENYSTMEVKLHAYKK